MFVKSAFLALLVLFIAGLCPQGASAGSVAARSAAYWTARIPNADEAVLDDEGIRELNRSILEKTDQMADLSAMPDAISGKDLKAWLLYDPLPRSVLRFDSNGLEAGEEFYSAVEANLALDAISDANPVIFGVAVKRADLRAFPTDEPLYKGKGRDEFDTLQYSSIFPAEPVALLHTSRDKEWGFFQTASARGWMRLSNAAFSPRADALLGAESQARKAHGFIVVTGSSVKADVGNGKGAIVFPMGSVLYIDGKAPSKKGLLPVLLPERSTGGALVWVRGYVKKGRDVNPGYLPYTRRNVITQAFKMLGEEYGWGGRNGLRDCSSFIRDVFSTMGVRLPRNSRQQKAIGRLIAERGPLGQALKEAVKGADPGVTLFGLERHIMLYIGSKGGRPYVIHQVFGFNENGRFVRRNRAVVTALSFSPASLGTKIKSVNAIKASVDRKASIGEKTS